MFHLDCTVEVTEEVSIREGKFDVDKGRQTEKNRGQKLSEQRGRGRHKSRHLTGRLAPLTGTDTLHYPGRIVCTHIFMVRMRVSVCDSSA